MNPFHHHLHTRSREVSLTEAERARMRRVVEGYMRMHPRHAAHPRISPLSSFSLLFSRHALAFVLIGAVLTSSAGVSYAAEQALPGETLYPVKTRVNEPLRGALAVSPKQKAAWAIQVADERAKEAATLAAQQKLDAETRSAIEENFRAHATLAADTIARVADEDPLDGAQTATRFEARIAEYERVIVALAPEEADHQELARAFRAERASIADARARAEERAERDTDDSFQRAAIASVHEADDRLAAARTAFATSTAETMAAQLEATRETIADNTREKPGEAARDMRATARKALRDAEKLRAFAETSAAIHARTGRVIEPDDRPRARRPDTLAKRPALAEIEPVTAVAAMPAPESASLMMAAPAEDARMDMPAGQEERPESREEKRDEDRDEARTDSKTIRLPLPELDDDTDED